MDARQAPESRSPETAGQQFVRLIRPAGCVLFIAVAILVTVLCFTSGRDPIPGYETPRTTEYYAAHPEELAGELEENVFPALPDAVLTAEAGEETVTVTVESGNFAVVRSTILRYFDKSLLEFRQG